MSIEPLPRLNKTITQIDALWRQQQVQIDWANLELMRQNYFDGQVWNGGIVPACIEWQCQIVEGNRSQEEQHHA